MESGFEERPSSRARERARSLTLQTWEASWDASFPFMVVSTSFSAFFTVSFPISCEVIFYSKSDSDNRRRGRSTNKAEREQKTGLRPFPCALTIWPKVLCFYFFTPETNIWKFVRRITTSCRPLLQDKTDLLQFGFIGSEFRFKKAS